MRSERDIIIDKLLDRDLAVHEALGASDGALLAMEEAMRYLYMASPLDELMDDLYGEDE